MGGKMIVTTVMVHVKKEHIDDFLRETIKNHQESIKETGNRRFDVLQSPEDPTMFMLYEAYDSQESAAAHKKTAHYAQWKDMVADWMAEPRKGIPYKGIMP
jgi:(4S)-4-hydroxy-5-phosphonooxypentane-2,3-dione isomerase